jgi:hypothetical protein
VAVVWGITGSFIVVEILGQATFTTLRRTVPWFRARTLSPTVFNSTTCHSESAGARAEPSGDVQAGAWSLGVSEGTLAQARMMVERSPRVNDAARQMLQSMTDGTHAVAAALQVPASTFVPEHAVNANTEFLLFVEESDTARRLTAMYSPTVCHLYKLGAYWGFALLPRTSLPGTGNIFAAEIEHHAAAAGLAEAAWKPLAAPTAADATGETLAKDGESLTAAMTAYLTSR